MRGTMVVVLALTGGLVLADGIIAMVLGRPRKHWRWLTLVGNTVSPTEVRLASALLLVIGAYLVTFGASIQTGLLSDHPWVSLAYAGLVVGIGTIRLLAHHQGAGLRAAKRPGDRPQ